MNRELYSYCMLSSREILGLLNDSINDPELSSMYEEYNSLFSSKKSDASWILMSEALLASEGLIKSEKLYDLLLNRERTIREVKRSLLEGNGEYVSRGQRDEVGLSVLDRNNVVANSFSELINGIAFEDPTEKLTDSEFVTLMKKEMSKPIDKIAENILEKKEANRLEKESLQYEEHERYIESYMADGKYGCNDAILTEGKLDYKKLIIRVRNALAHSNYSVVDDNYIRLYHTNRKEKKLDFNVYLDKNTIMTIVDELNEIAYEITSDLQIDYDTSTYYDLPENQLLPKLVSYNLLSKEECIEIIKNVKKNLKFTDNIQTIALEEYADRLGTLFAPAIIANDYVYGRYADEMEDTYYNKLGFYKYLSADLGGIFNYNSRDVYSVENTKLLMLSFLNCNLLNGFNINENKNIGVIDFSKMKISEKSLNIFLKRHIDKNSAIREKLTGSKNKLSERIVKVRSVIKNKETLLNNSVIDNEYYKSTLPNDIKYHQGKLIEIQSEYEKVKTELNKMDELGIKYNYDFDYTDYILRSLRNSLAHGNAKADNNVKDNISNSFITFEDVDPENKENITFRGEIKVKDLLKIITSPKYVSNIFSNENKNSNKKR